MRSVAVAGVGRRGRRDHTIRKLALMSDGTDIQVMVFRDAEEERYWLTGFPK